MTQFHSRFLSQVPKMAIDKAAPGNAEIFLLAVAHSLNYRQQFRKVESCGKCGWDIFLTIMFNFQRETLQR